jgi:hypothetical protein
MHVPPPQAVLRSPQVWVQPFSQVRPQLLGASQAVGRLAAESRGLTQDWVLGLDPESRGHKWSGAPYQDPLLLALHERIEEVCVSRWGTHAKGHFQLSAISWPSAGIGLKLCNSHFPSKKIANVYHLCTRFIGFRALLQIYGMRESHQELSRLLGSEEASALGCDHVFEPLSRCSAAGGGDGAVGAHSPLHVSPYAAAGWAAARAEFEARMAPLEQRVSHKLRERLGA